MTNISVLYICYGNSYRSQMAEAFTRYYSMGKVDAYSAGIAPVKRVSPRTKEVLHEKNIRVKGLKTEHVFAAPSCQHAVIMGNDVKLRFPSRVAGKLYFWNFPDPSCFDMAELREIRDKIEQKVLNFLKRLDISSFAHL